jgi:hypothetical protein
MKDGVITENIFLLSLASFKTLPYLCPIEKLKKTCIMKNFKRNKDGNYSGNGLLVIFSKKGYFSNYRYSAEVFLPSVSDSEPLFRFPYVKTQRELLEGLSKIEGLNELVWGDFANKTENNENTEKADKAYKQLSDLRYSLQR